MNAAAQIDRVLETYRGLQKPLLGFGSAPDEWLYLTHERDAYVRTLKDAQALWGTGQNRQKLLEIGSFLGVISLALKNNGFEVCAADIPEFHRSEALRTLYTSQGVDFAPLNLRTQSLPYADESFDGVLLCEVMEHFNFNPLPALQEINRVLRPGGYAYVAMPNQSSLAHRLALLRGLSIRNPVRDFFRQLDASQNMLVGLHWREYTLAETVEIFEAMGFRARQTAYFYHPGSGWKKILKQLLFAYPPFRPFYTATFQKERLPSYDFWRTEANS